MQSIRQVHVIFISLLLLTPLVISSALLIGSISLSMHDIWHALVSEQSTTTSQIIHVLRLPRILGAFSCGALLALAGALMQVLLRNPLADPYILGISGGAAVVTLILMTIGFTGFVLTSGAFAGSMLSMFIVFGLAQAKGSWSPTRLLLTGIVVAAGWGAVISFILAVAPDKNLHSMLFWLMGDLSYINTVWPSYVVLTIAFVLTMMIARHLNILLHGALKASSVGIDVKRIRLFVYLLASLITATAVTIAGTIGFIGLIVPHILRLLGVTKHRWLIPCSCLLGGCLLVVADSVARIIIQPHQLPVGVITAMIGVPIFLILLHRSNQAL